MKKKPMRILFSLLFVAVLATAFSITAFAAGEMWQAQSKALGTLPRDKFRLSSIMWCFRSAT